MTKLFLDVPDPSTSGLDTVCENGPTLWVVAVVVAALALCVGFALLYRRKSQKIG